MNTFAFGQEDYRKFKLNGKIGLVNAVNNEEIIEPNYNSINLIDYDTYELFKEGNEFHYNIIT